MKAYHQDTLQQLSCYDPTPECPYPQVLLERDTPMNLRGIFFLVTTISGHSAGRPVLCWDFLPQLHLYVCSRWRESDGLDYLEHDWLGAKDCLDFWLEHLGPQGSSTGCSTNLSHGHVSVTTQPVAQYQSDLAMKIVRK